MVVEVLRPNRQLRRTRGKSDPLDAYAAARTALAQEEHATPKAGAGQVEAIRYLLVARRSAVKARTAAIVQIKSLLVTAPDLIREWAAAMFSDSSSPVNWVGKSPGGAIHVS